MKRTLALLSLLAAFATGAASAQTSVRLSVGFGDPYLSGYVVVGTPTYYPYYFAHPIYVPERRIFVVPRYQFDRWRHDRGWHRGWNQRGDRNDWRRDRNDWRRDRGDRDDRR